MRVLVPVAIPELPAWPSLSDTEAVFDSKADAVGGAMPGTVAAINVIAGNMLNNAQYVEVAADAGLAMSNFKGAWSGLTGALNVPASTYHNGMYWQLLSNLANVTTDQPGVASTWVLLPGPADACNFLDNGGATVEQVTGTTLTSSSAHSNADRFYVAAGGGTGVSGTNGVGLATGFATGRGVGVVSASFTTGAVQIKQRTESARTKFLNSKTVTISCKVYHDFGTARSLTLQLLKCNAIDNWAAMTSISTSAAVSCASGAYTTVKLTATLGAADATNGLEVVLLDTATATVVSKSMIASEWKMEVGSVATPFQLENYDDALRRCQRYYEVMGGDSAGSLVIFEGWANYISQAAFLTVGYKAEKFKAPTVTVSGTWALTNVTGGVTAPYVGKGEVTLSIGATAVSNSFSGINNGGAAKVLIDSRL